LRLAALSLRHRDWSDDLAMNIEGDSRYIQEYLLAEVLSHLPAAKQAWLLKTSVLDRFCARLLDAVCLTGSGDSASLANVTGEVFISRLQRENLFLVPLDGQGEWFRFHHLFQQYLFGLLQAQLDAAEIAALRRSASRWYAENGLLQEALQYALRAGDVDAAVHLAEQHRYSLMNTEQWSRLNRWLKLLPEDVVAQSPLLCSARAFLALYRGPVSEMVTALQQAELLLTNQPPEAAEVQVVRAELAVIQGALDIMVGQPADVIAKAQRNLEVLPSQALHIRSIAVGTIALGLQMQGDLQQAVAAIREALSGRTWPAELHAKIAHYLCLAFLQEGDLTGVLRLAREHLPAAGQYQLGESLSWMRYNLGIAHYLRNEFAKAEPYLLALMDDHATSVPTYLANGVCALALILHYSGRGSEAEHVIDQVSAYLGQIEDPFARVYTELFRVELALRQGQLLRAGRLGQSLDFDLAPIIWLFYVPQLTAIKLLLAEGTGSGLDEARTRLDALDEQMGKIHRHNVRIDVLALLALVHDALGDEATAMEKLSVALSLGVRGGFIRTFVDLGAPMADLLSRWWEVQAGSQEVGYIDRILAAFAAEERATTRQKPQPATMPPENPLTRRERQVIRLLATDLSQQDIADKLVISPHTLNTHTKNIYRKLEVRKRAEAVRRAREMDLLP
jgi:LuxR family maltose regulon positive regulatory protein